MKKKLLSMLVLILAIISIQIAVFADMDAPSVKPYTATISNVDGAKIYDFIEDGNDSSRFEDVGSLKYGDSIKIIYEVDIEGELYGIYHVKGEYEGPTLYIKINDIKVLEESPIEPSKDTLKTGKEAVVLVDGVELYEGPAYGYEKEGTVLSKGTEITLYDDKENAGNPWYYAKINEVSGWICTLNGSVGVKGKNANYYEKNMEIMTGKEVKIYKDTTYTEIEGRIPANTKIENYFEIDDWSWGLYVEYNELSGYIASEDYATNIPWIKEKSFEYIVDYPAKIYKEADLRSDVLVEELPLGTKLEATYAVNTRMTTWIYVTYNGVGGWLFDVKELLSDGETYQDILDRELEYYKLEEENEEKVNTENVSNEDFDTDNISDEEMVNDIATNKDEKLYAISGMQIVLICVGFAIVLALTVLVTIILVNKNNKKAEVKEENKK